MDRQQVCILLEVTVMKAKQLIALLAACLILVATGFMGAYSARQERSLMEETGTDIARNVLSNFYPGGETEIVLPETDFAARIDIVGTIQPSAGGGLVNGATGQYDHSLYMDLVNRLMESENNRGILLYVDSPGGTVYESDELYLKLMEYKEKTGRPIYAYFASTAASGGYYISMASDYIYANRNCTTGSIGVIMSYYDYHKLLEKVGVEEIDITTGANKTIGSGASETTDEQREILQAYVDESYDRFVDIVASGRGMKNKAVRKLADGRIYTAAQAKENGLIDEIMGEEDAMDAIAEKLGDPDIEFYSPEPAYQTPLFSFLGQMSQLFGRENSESDLVRSFMERRREGELMYYAK
jgi:protease-4